MQEMQVDFITVFTWANSKQLHVAIHSKKHKILQVLLFKVATYKIPQIPYFTC